MAGTACVTYIFLNPPTIRCPHPVTIATHKFRLLKPPRASSTSTPFPSNRTKRKNHLRPKILKTLTKPLPTAPLPLIEATPPPNDPVFDTPLNEILSTEELEADRAEEFRASNSVGTAAGEYSSNTGKFSVKSVLKYSGYVVGVVFLFQTVSAVWTFGNTDSDRSERSSNNLDYKGNVLLDVNGNVVYINEKEQEERINEIREMAREARERERGELIEGDTESEIEKEIGARLVKLEKRFNSKREKLPDSFMEYLGLFRKEEDGFDEDGLDSKVDDKKLVFKKKFRFKSPSMDVSSSPKGFSGLTDHSGSGSVSGTGTNGAKDRVSKAASTESNSVQNEGNKLERERKILLKEVESGVIQETREERPSVEVKKAGKSLDLEIQNSKALTRENQGTTTKFDGPALSSRNGRKDSGRPVADKVGDGQSNVRTELWWSNLPYVLGILMHRGSEHEGQGGLYALQVTSEVDDERDSSYTIAFEDRGDANNFCYLLESFFEELGDFSADIIPLSIKELHDAVQSHSKKVIVVKKRQLKLYVGQPFTEVEMALRSLLEQNQSA